MSCSIAKLAFKDWLYEFSMSVCAVLALASILAPIIVLHGIHTGVIEQMRHRLLKDPAVLVVIPIGSKGKGFSEEFIESVRSREECEFAIGRTRDVAAELQITTDVGKSLIISLEATSEGDPLMIRNGINSFPTSSPNNFEMVVTNDVAKRLNIKVGDKVRASLGRRLVTGKFERKVLEISIKNILPAKAVSMTSGFIDLNFLVSIQNFRDGLNVDLFKIKGDELPEHNHFESFRAYVRDLDSVESFEEWFKSQNVEVKTRSRDIANIRNVDQSLSIIILVITATSCIGFFAFMMSTIHANVRRKWKMLGMLRLLGYSRLSMLCFPIFQAVVTGILGVLLSFILYGIVAYIIDSLFSMVDTDVKVCMVPTVDFISILIVIQLIVIGASLKAALKASSIDPSIVMREN